MNRLERISAILIQLQSRPVVTAHQIAKQFDISLRTVYRDIRTLEEAGIPLIGNVGVGYSLVEGYKLPPMMFTREEAIAFLTAEKFVEQMTDPQNIQHYKMGMSKIRAVLKCIEKDYITGIEDYIQVVNRTDSHEQLPRDITQCILKSISERRSLHIQYESNQKVTKRDIEPVGCIYKHEHWYLIAYCKLRDDYRNFRIDRIQSYHLTNDTFKQVQRSLSELMAVFKEQFLEQTEEVCIRVDNENVGLFTDCSYFYGYHTQVVNDSYTDLYFQIFDVAYFARWFISFADVATIIYPENLKDSVRKIYSNIKI